MSLMGQKSSFFMTLTIQKYFVIIKLQKGTACSAGWSNT